MFDATGVITVFAPPGLPYNIAIDSGLNPQPQSFNQCREMQGIDPGVKRPYAIFKDPSFSSLWGDLDFGATCDGEITNGTSKAATGMGTDDFHTVYARVYPEPGAGVGLVSDTLTVTVHY